MPRIEEEPEPVVAEGEGEVAASDVPASEQKPEGEETAAKEGKEGGKEGKKGKESKE
jgi:hypothetical protein